MNTLQPLQIGITGGIGTGKSMVSRIFEKLGVPVYNADSRAKSVMTTDGILVDAIKKEFGLLSYNEGGELNRDYLAKAVFGDQKRLDVLNALVHPRVAEDYKNWLVMQKRFSYTLKEAALLYESQSYASLDKIIVVYSPEALRMKRILLRDKSRSEEDVRKVMHKQLPEEDKLKRADYVIKNDEQHMLIQQVLDLHTNFLKMAAERKKTTDLLS